MTRKGYVYVGLDASSNLFKIGRSNNPGARERQIRQMNPTFRLMAMGEADDCFSEEARIHKKYEHKRVNGEWFCLSQEEVSEIIGSNISDAEIYEIRIKLKRNNDVEIEQTRIKLGVTL
jgi:hypothetical protein